MVEITDIAEEEFNQQPVDSTVPVVDVVEETVDIANDTEKPAETALKDDEEEGEDDGEEEEADEYETTDDEEDEDFDYFDEEETLMDRVRALKDIIPPQQRATISSLYDRARSLSKTAFSKSTSVTWAITTSALLLGVPLSLTILAEQQLIEMEKQFQLQGDANELLGGVPAEQSATI